MGFLYQNEYKLESPVAEYALGFINLNCDNMFVHKFGTVNNQN